MVGGFLRLGCLTTAATTRAARSFIILRAITNPGAEEEEEDEGGEIKAGSVVANDDGEASSGICKL